MTKQDQAQQLEVQVVNLKARLYDAGEQLNLLNEFITQVAQRVSFKGQSYEELLQAIPEVKPEVEPEVVKEGE